jgi:hypothetical protein
VWYAVEVRPAGYRERCAGACRCVYYCLIVLLSSRAVADATRAPTEGSASSRVDSERSFSAFMAGRPIEILPPPTEAELAKIKSSWGTSGCGVSTVHVSLDVLRR